MSTRRYPTDATDDQWRLIDELIGPQKGAGRPRKTDLRRVVDGILYLSRAGCQWRMLPHDFPPWNTVNYYFNKWKRDGTLARIHDALSDRVREKDRPKERTSASVDSQSTDSHGTRQARGFDGGKRLDGRKRHLAVDSLGLLLAVAVTAGNVSDAAGGVACLSRLDPDRHPRLDTIHADGAYGKAGFPRFVARWKPGCRVVVVARAKKQKGFVRLPIRRVVERTNAWLTKNRRLCRSYEPTVSSEEAFIRIAMIHRNVRRLIPGPHQPKFCYKRAPKVA